MGKRVLLPFSERHLPEAVEIERASFTSPWSMSLLRGEIDNPAAVFWAAEEDGRLAGYLDLMTVLDEGHIMNLAVHPAMRRKGVAAALLTRAMSYARREGLVSLTLEVRDSNAAARALYARFGFQVVGRRRRYYEYPVEDAVLMTWDVKPG